MSEGFSRENFKELPDNYWFEVVNRIKEKFGGEKPSPMEVRASVLLELAGIPSGQHSALKTDKEGKRTDPKGDEVIAEYLTNPAGLMVSGTQGITTRDLRDRYPDGLPAEVLQHIDEKTQKIIGAMYEYDKYAQENFPHIWQHSKAEQSANLHFLPGGIPLVLVGYQHDKNWQKTYGKYMKEIGKEASVVAIEGFTNAPLGASLDVMWKINPSSRVGGNYDVLMKDLVACGYSGIFTEIDGRDVSKMELEHIDFLFPLGLSDSFYEKYLTYLKRESPKFGAHIGDGKRLKKILATQHPLGDMNFFGSLNLSANKYQRGKNYYSRPAFSDTGKVSLTPTGNELGQSIFTDALAAIKLHLLGKMMNDGRISKGPIVDYEGAHHVPSKSFFLQYPEYAMEIVLRTIPELLAGTAEKLKTNDESVELHAKKVFEHTDWEQVIREVFRIPFKKIDDPKPGRDGVEIGPNQRPMMEVYSDRYVLETILRERSTKDVAEKMEELIQKLAF